MLTNTLRLLLVGTVSILLIACDSTEDDSTDPLLTETSSANSTDCPAGGSSVVFGYDTNEDGSINEIIDSTTICNGSSAQELLVEQSYDDSCEMGGTALTFGYDTVGDSAIDTVVDTVIICSLNTALNAIHGLSVLYYDVYESELPPDRFIEVLSDLDEQGIIELTEATEDTIVDNLNNGDFDVVIYSERNTSVPAAHVTALSDWIDSGKAAILSTYNSNADLHSAFESTRLGTNESLATLTDNIVGLYLKNIPVTNAGGWGTFSLQLEPIDTAYSACTWENDTSCAIVGNGGTTVNLGILVDSLTPEDARVLLPNLIRQVSL